MIRILQVIDKMDISSGVYSMLINYYRFIDKEKIIFDFVVHDEVSEDLKEYYIDKGSIIYKLSDLSFKNLFSNAKVFTRILESNKYSIIHIHIPNIAFLYFNIAKRCKIPIRIMHSHNSVGSEILWKRIRNKILNQIGLFYANRYWACSKLSAKYLFGNKKIETEKFKLINNAIEVDKYKYNQLIRCEKRNEYNLNNKYVIGNIGRLAVQKNQEYLIDVFYEFHKNNLDSILLIIGEGELKSKIENKISDYNLNDSVYLLGARKDVNEILQVIDVFVLPSLFEGLPVVSIEAQAAGLRCILSDTITKECSITENVIFLNLKDKYSWLNALTNCRKYNRINTDQYIIKNHYSISEEAVYLQECYLQEYNNLLI
ncbi:glycosyltransferase [Diplocloster hominis]|uniref:glycosyltransferase n=1 Tax=Diplocloster hominis TaxID=3079010 RepID=UPI0031BB7B55